MKKFFRNIKARAAKIRRGASSLYDRAIEYKNALDGDRVRKNRFLILFISTLLIFNYLMFCYHTNKNPFDIFPSLPKLDLRERRDIYVPANDGKTLLKESRKMEVPDEMEKFAALIFGMVSKGSIYENTSGAVPIDAYVRTVWIKGDTCYIDAGPAVLREDAPVIPGSEDNFRAALEKSIVENIPSIKRVMLLEKGVPSKRLWEVASDAN